MKRVKIDEAQAGDIVAIAGIEDVQIGDTVADPEHPEPLPRIQVEEPTIKISFLVNTSPFAGKVGKWVTSRHVRERLEREARRNLALRFEPTNEPDTFTRLRPRRADAGDSRRDHAARGLRVRARHAGSGHARHRRAALRARRARGGRRARRIRGRGDHTARRATRADDQDEQSWLRAGAHGVPRALARLDRLPLVVPDRDARHRASEHAVRRLGAVPRSHAAPFQRCHRRRPGRQYDAVRPVPPAAARRAVHRARCAGVRGHDRRRAQPRQRPGRERHAREEAHEHPRREP